MPTKSKTRGTKRTTGKTYRVLEEGSGLAYPVSRAIRDRIRAGERIPRGEVKVYKVGDKIANPPSDLIKSWLGHGFVDLIKSKEVSSDTPK